jgi:hypothetical protein
LHAYLAEFLGARRACLHKMAAARSMRVKGLALAVAVLASHSCQAQQARGSGSASKTGSDASGAFFRDGLAFPDRRLLDTGGESWNETNFDSWDIGSSPTDWVLTAAEKAGGKGTTTAAVERNKSEGFGGKLSNSANEEKNSTDSVAFDPFLEEEAGTRVSKTSIH